MADQPDVTVEDIDPEVRSAGDIEGKDSRLYNEDLAPVPPEKRNWSTYNYAALWIGMAHCIPTYMLASDLVAKGMNWKQAIFTITLGNLIVLVPMLLNSYGGTKYGIPFPVLCRSSFGVLGANIPAILRALVACGWFGIQTWIGGQALSKLLGSLAPGWNDIGQVGDFICFFAFWGLNMWIIWRGMNAIRWFEGWAAPTVLVVAVVLLVYMVNRAHGFGLIVEQSGKYEDLGLFLSKLPIFLTAQIGFWATLSLNMPDFTRYSKSQKSQMLGQTLGLPTTMTFFSTIGVLITAATQVVYHEAISNPVDLLAKPEFANPIVVCVSLISIGVATLSVNVAANVVSPAFDFSNLWPKKIDFKIGGTITGIIGILICPWKLFAPGIYIFTWLVGYSGLLGPIAGIMICDFWVLRRRHLHVQDLYRVEGKYAYKGGFNWTAIVALVLGILPNVPGFVLKLRHPEDDDMLAFVKTLEPGLQSLTNTANLIYSFAWMVGFAVAFGVYYFLMQTFEKQSVQADSAAAVPA